MKDVIKSQPIEEYKVINGQKVRVNRRKRRSNLNTYCALAIVFVAVIVLILCMTVFFNVKEIKVSGVSLYSKEQVLAVGGASNGINLIRTNTDVIEKRLLDNLVYIDEVTVTKDYPAAISINVKEAVKAADIEYNNKYYVLSESGKILESANGSRSEGIPLVKGFELKSLSPNDKLESEDAFKTKILQQLMEQIKSQGFEDIRVIDLTDRTDIKLDYDGRIEIKLGSSVDLDYKLTYIKAVIDECLTDSYEGTLRYNGVNSGISAIPKSDEQSGAGSAKPDNTDESSQTEPAGTEMTGDDSSQAEDNGGETDHDTGDAGYGDDYSDDNTGWGYDDTDTDYTDTTYEDGTYTDDYGTDGADNGGYAQTDGGYDENGNYNGWQQDGYSGEDTQ